MARHLLETKDFNKNEVEQILDLAQSFLESKPRNSLNGHIIITIFLKTLPARSLALKLQLKD